MGDLFGAMSEEDMREEDMLVVATSHSVDRIEEFVQSRPDLLNQYFASEGSGVGSLELTLSICEDFHYDRRVQW